jgi:hypothetical protein
LKAIARQESNRQELKPYLRYLRPGYAFHPPIIAKRPINPYSDGNTNKDIYLQVPAKNNANTTHLTGT